MKESKEHPPSRVFLFILQWTKRQLTPCVDPCLAHVRTIRKKGPMTDLLNCQDGEGVSSWNPSSQDESPPDERMYEGFPSLSDSGTQEKGNHLLYLDISARLSETNSTARWHGGLAIVYVSSSSSKTFWFLYISPPGLPAGCPSSL